MWGKTQSKYSGWEKGDTCRWDKRYREGMERKGKLRDKIEKKMDTNVTKSTESDSMYCDDGLKWKLYAWVSSTNIINIISLAFWN